MALVVQLEDVIGGKVVGRSKIAALDRPGKLEILDDLGLRLTDAKTLLANIQAEVVTRQIAHDAEQRSRCPGCGKRRRLNDYRPRQFETLFGRIEVRVPRFDDPDCGCDDACIQNTAPSALRWRSAHHHPKSDVRAAEQIITHASQQAAISEAIQPARALTLQLDHTYVRAAQSESTRHLPVLTGEIEPDEGGPKRRFASLDEDREPATIVREHLAQSGYTEHTALTALTDADDGLRNMARAAYDGFIVLILDWFHLAMRLWPLEQIAQGLRTHVQAKINIVDALEHLHWRLWHGKLDTLAECYEQVRVAIRAFVNYHRRQHARLRVSGCGWSRLSRPSSTTG